MADFSAWMSKTFSPTKRAVDDNSLSTEELYEAGVDIPKGDQRLKAGLDRSKLSDDERKKLDSYRKSK